jgi:predicted type IV restriction endonuclease
MTKIPSKVEVRIKEALKRYQPLVEQAKARDVGEADTSTLVKDILADLFGYDKYSEITAEYQIKGTYCDLALKVDGKLTILVEVKSFNTELKEQHVKQAVDYAANQGVEWVILTNGQTWQVYRVCFAQPISNELMMTLAFGTLNAKSATDLESIFLLTREAQSKSLLDEYHEQRLALSRYCVGAVVLSESVINVIRRELKRLSPDVRIEAEEIERVLSDEVIKREVLEGEKAMEAKKRLAKAAAKALRKIEKDMVVSQPGSSTPASGNHGVSIPTITSVADPKAPATTP